MTTDKQMIAALIQRHGADGLLGEIADYLEGQAEQHEDVKPDSAAAYDDCARLARKCGRDVRDRLTL